MYRIRKITLVLIIIFILLGLTGCSSKAADNQPIGEKKTLSINKLNISYPSNWAKSGNENEIFFNDENKQSVGGVTIVGFYNDYKSSLPNHSEVISTEDIKTSIGEGKLFTLKLSEPAASGSGKTWTEFHAFIPAEENMAYDFWVIGDKNSLLEILNSIK